MYHEDYGNREKAKELYQTIPGNKRLLTPTMINIAESSCPQGIKIGEKLQLAKSLLNPLPSVT